MKCEGLTVLITGATSGIGLAIAEEFHRRKNQVVVASRSPEKLLELSEKLPGIKTIAVDLSVPEAAEVISRFTTEQQIKIDILINNAGVQITENWKHGEINGTDSFQTNLLTPARLCEIYFRQMLNQPEAAIVNVGSGLAFVPRTNAVSYCAAKAALHSFSQSVRAQAKGTSIRVVELFPALTDTAMTSGRGKNKLSPQDVAAALIRGLEKNTFEIFTGKIRLLRLISRLAPRYATRLISRD